MVFLLDTSVLINLRDFHPQIRAAAAALPDPVVMSIISRVELEGGVYRDATSAPERRARADAILTLIPALPFGEPDAEAYARIVTHAGYSRRKLLDRMIAAQALVHRATLVTMNAEDFADVPGLSVLAW